MIEQVVYLNSAWDALGGWHVVRRHVLIAYKYILDNKGLESKA
jgi:hypothetical protein